MILKKQTIWLLTMLSLIVVLSVYYVQSPSPTPGEEVAMMNEENENNEEEATETDGEGLVTNLEEELEKADDGKESEDEGKEEEKEGKEQEDEKNPEQKPEQENAEPTEDEIISNVTSGDTFATLRMELQAARDRLAEEFTQIIAAEDTSALMKSEAHDNNTNLIRIAQNEATLETLIKAKGYEDALVMAEEDKVQIIVQADELSKAEANEILHLTFDRFGDGLNVAVSHQVPSNN